MAAETPAAGLRTRRQGEVAKRSALDADEEAVQLEKSAEDDEERPVPALGPGRAPPVEVSLIDVAMVEPRHREPPAEAAVDCEAGGRAGREQLGSRVAADMTRPHIASAEELRVRGHGEREHSLRAKHAGGLSKCASVVLDVLQHLAEDDGVEAVIFEGKRG